MWPIKKAPLPFTTNTAALFYLFSVLPLFVLSDPSSSPKHFSLSCSCLRFLFLFLTYRPFPLIYPCLTFILFDLIFSQYALNLLSMSLRLPFPPCFPFYSFAIFLISILYLWHFLLLLGTSYFYLLLNLPFFIPSLMVSQYAVNVFSRSYISYFYPLSPFHSYGILFPPILPSSLSPLLNFLSNLYSSLSSFAIHLLH